LGTFTVEEILKKFSELQPHESQAHKEVKSKAYYGGCKEEVKEECEFSKLEKELQDKIFLEGAGFEIGKRDHESYEKLKDTVIDQAKFPNLNRWKKYLAHLSSKK